MQLADLKWPDIDALSRDTPIVIPVAALEQHGRHMPLFTDSLLLGEVVRRVSERLQDRVLFTPLMWLGNSEHHLDFPGTMSAAPRVYLDLLKDMLENFLFHGFRRLLIFNGHATSCRRRRRSSCGKISPTDGLTLLSATYWTLGTRPPESGSIVRPTADGAPPAVKLPRCGSPRISSAYRANPLVPQPDPFNQHRRGSPRSYGAGTYRRSAAGTAEERNCCSAVSPMTWQRCRRLAAWDGRAIV
jgi:creatinine amidohydrolase